MIDRSMYVIINYDGVIAIPHTIASPLFAGMRHYNVIIRRRMRMARCSMHTRMTQAPPTPVTCPCAIRTANVV